MTEADAQDWIAERFGRQAVDRVGQFGALLVAEAQQQNLIAPSTIPTLWVRHLLDSAQLALWGGDGGRWIDVGTGGGLPGMVLAILLDRPFTLVEPRRLRARFLEFCADRLGLTGRVVVQDRRIETVRERAATISARAVSPLDVLIASARHCADRSTIWVLPRGQGGAREVERLAMAAPATFHVKPSVSDPAAAIVVATGIGA